MKNLVGVTLALVFVGYCFFLYNGHQMFPDPHPDPPMAQSSSHAAHHPVTIKDVNGRLWKCAVKDGTYGCTPMPGRVG